MTSIDRLTAQEQIRAVSADLPQLFDARTDQAALIAHLTCDVEVTLSLPARRWQGTEQVGDAIDRCWSAWQGTASFVTNLAVHWEGDLAVATSYLQCWIWRAGTSENGDRRPADRVHTWAVEDLFVPSGDDWQVRRRRLRHLGPDGVGI